MPGDDDDEFVEDVHPIVVIVALACLARVAWAIWTRETAGADATLAGLMLVAISWHAWACVSLRRQARRAQAMTRSEPRTTP